jgi:hypothetical protein
VTRGDVDDLASPEVVADDDAFAVDRLQRDLRAVLPKQVAKLVSTGCSACPG